MRPALDRTDYTADRALLIVRRGLCGCGAAPARPGRRRRAAAPAETSGGVPGNTPGRPSGRTSGETPGAGPKPANNPESTSPVSRRFA
ncbi:hypothetical protein [Actinomadura violacea]|uniref:Uncharacterized protein n=1 Tax=Actinomadura violacea TaxID=2819934 RepID=A0ABS3RMF6_9ACTN|nr:hypothetical protein [Actinomadura violacea]MBO2457254.1 hypothetical protein [Actinomadura violacea]